MPRRPKIVLRADASPEHGLGHVMRSMTLARALADAGADVSFIGSGIPDEVASYSRPTVEIKAGPTGGDADDASNIAAEQPDFVMVDGYSFTKEFFAALELAGIRYGVIDDNAETKANAPDLVLNQNPHATRDSYEHLAGAPVLLLGLEHVLIRPEVRSLSMAPRPISPDRVFVALGGSDTAELTLPIAAALRELHCDVRVAVGPAVPDRDDVVNAVSQLGRVHVVAEAAYADELASSGLAVLAAGTSLWEAACLRVGTVAIIVAENQRASATAASHSGLTLAVFDATNDRAQIAPLVADAVRDHLPAARTTTTGCHSLAGGTDRVARAVLDIATRTDPRHDMTPSLTLRPATADDSDFLLDLRNDQEVIRVSLQDRAVTADEHARWLSDTLGRRDRRLYIVCDAELPIGQVRIDDAADGSLVSIALTSTTRGHGIGTKVLRLVQAIAEAPLLADVRDENHRSLAAFTKVGFEPADAKGGVIRLRWSPDSGT